MRTTLVIGDEKAVRDKNYSVPEYWDFSQEQRWLWEAHSIPRSCGWNHFSPRCNNFLYQRFCMESIWSCSPVFCISWCRCLHVLVTRVYYWNSCLVQFPSVLHRRTTCAAYQLSGHEVKWVLFQAKPALYVEIGSHLYALHIVSDDYLWSLRWQK